MKIEIRTIDNGCIVEYTPNFLQGTRASFYDDWNVAIDAAINILEEERYDETGDTSEKRLQEDQE